MGPTQTIELELKQWRSAISEARAKLTSVDELSGNCADEYRTVSDGLVGHLELLGRERAEASALHAALTAIALKEAEQ